MGTAVAANNNGKRHLQNDQLSKAGFRSLSDEDSLESRYLPLLFLYPGSGLWEGSGLIVDKSLLAVAHFLTQMHTGGRSTNMCSHFEGEF